MCVRRVFQWSGWLQRVSSTVFIRFRVTSGLTGSCCGRFSHWVRLKPLYYVAGQFDLHWFLSCWKYWLNYDFFFHDVLGFFFIFYLESLKCMQFWHLCLQDFYYDVMFLSSLTHNFMAKGSWAENKITFIFMHILWFKDIYTALMVNSFI